VKIKLITPDPHNAKAWSDALRVERAFEVASIVHALRDVNVIVNGTRPDLVLVETTTPQDFLALEALANAHPEIDYVLVGNELSPEFSAAQVAPASVLLKTPPPLADPA